MQTTFNYDHYYDWQEMSRCLKQLAEQHSSLMRLESICVSEEGKDVWAVTLTDSSSGEASAKPAYYIDGNHHAGEVTGSMAAMYTADLLCTNYNKDEKITDLLKNYTFYIIPKISPDGSDVYLHSDQRLRSVNRNYPLSKLTDGLHPGDIDGDGVIRMMRVKTPYGAWKVSEKDPQVMTKRTPFDAQGDFYNIYPEGEIINYDGLHIELAKEKWGLDFNRNYPFGWFTEVRQPGAGKYPLSNPENKAVADFVLTHSNIGFVSTLHTTGGVLVYPPGTYPEAKALKKDMDLFKKVGKMAKQIMGYETVNIFDGFLTDIENYSSGAFDDWCYETQGIPAYTIELWNLFERAGADMSWPRKDKDDDGQEAEYAMVLKWIKENVGESAIKPWTEFDHPQLGTVEIGGFDYKFIHQNPPCDYLLQEVEKTAKFMLANAYALPKLKFESVKTEKICDGIYKLEAVLGNTGYMPTYLTDSAKRQKIDQPIQITLSGCEVIEGEALLMVNELEGISGVNTYYGYDGITTQKHAPQLKRFTWIISGKQNDLVSLTASSQKAGKVSIQCIL